MFKIQRRKAKCKKCGKELYNTEAYQVIDGNKKSYYITEEEYNEIQKEKEQYNSCLERVAEITNVKLVPPVMIKKINEIRKFYDYYVIERTFKECQAIIQWAIDNRDFNNEFVKTKYITSIIANNIAKVDKKIKQEKEELERLFTKSNEIEIEVMDVVLNSEVRNKEVSDISMFLD